MAGWITHLRIAEKLVSSTERIVSPLHFYIGSIAPDGGVPTDTPDVYIPPKTVTHLGRRGSRDYSGFENKYLCQSTDPEAYCFYLGYYLHVVTDELWGTYIYFPEVEEFSNAFENKSAMNRAIKDNWEAIDLDFVRNNPNFKPYTMLAGVDSFPNLYLPDFPENAFSALLGRFREFYNISNNEPKSDMRYLSVERHAWFVDFCTENIIGTYFRKFFG